MVGQMTNTAESGHTGAQDVSTFPTGRHPHSRTLGSARFNLRSRWRGADVQQSRRRGGTAQTQVQPNHPRQPTPPPISAAQRRFVCHPRPTAQRVRGEEKHMPDTTHDDSAFPLPPGYQVDDRGMVTLHRTYPPTAAEVAWMWNTSKAIRVGMGLPPERTRR